MKIRIGTRKSKLAVWQSEWVKEQIKKHFPDVEVELVKIVTKGDKILDAPLAKIGDKGLFTKEIEEAMLKGDIDIAVHSLKDMPATLPEGLELIAFSKREDPRDALLSCGRYTLKTLPYGCTVGTSSLRRKALLRKIRPDMEIKDLRGNVDTRIKKLKRGDYDAIILAAAGIKRLGMTKEIDEAIPVEVMIPSVCQGILGIEGRIGNEKIKTILRNAVNDPTSEIVATAERSFLQTVGGGCQIPLGCHAYIKDRWIHIEAFISTLDASTFLRRSGIYPVNMPEKAGREIAEKLLKSGGEEILKELKACQ